MDPPSDPLASAAVPPPDTPASLNISDSSDHASDEHDAAAALEAEPILDWRKIQRLRQQRDATRAVINETETELKALRALRKRARQERDAVEQERALERFVLPSVHAQADRNPRPGPHKRMFQHPAELNEEDMHNPAEAKRLLTAIRGCCNRYSCSRQQKRSALFFALDDIPK